MTRVTVAGDAAYDVVIGHDLLRELPRMLGEARRVMVIYPGPLLSKARAVVAALEVANYQVFTHCVPDAEAQKTVAVAARCWAALGQAEFTRTDAIVAVGGGATTDLGGFVAATWLRGIKVVHVSTSLVGVVDAAVGGKTGINTAEGKNLVGAFYPPAGVICDLSMLETLPHRDFIAGLAEVIKTGFIADQRILDLVSEHASELRVWPDSAMGVQPNGGIWQVVTELVARSVAVKAKLVGEDFREQGQREFLNYGHTFGHAVEQVEHFQWRHGEAVSLGMVFVAELARAAGIASDDLLAKHYEVLQAVGLPTRYPLDDGADDPVRWERLQTAMRRDKKTRGTDLRFIVLPEVGKPTRLVAPSQQLLAEVYQKISH